MALLLLQSYLFDINLTINQDWLFPEQKFELQYMS